MKKNIIGIALALFTINSIETMHEPPKVFASWKDAALGKPRDFTAEINAALNDTSLSEPTRFRKAAALYTELRNLHIGKEKYATFNERACELRQRADEVEKKDREETMRAQELAEAQYYATREAEKAKQERYAEENDLVAFVQNVRKDESLKDLQRWELLKKSYTRLAELHETDDNKEQYNLYKNRLDKLEKQEEYCKLRDKLKSTFEKNKKVKVLRKLANVSPRPHISQKYHDEAEALQLEIDREEKAARYNSTFELLTQTTILVERARLHRILALYSDEKASENLAQAQQYEEQAEKERQQEEIVIVKVAEVANLNVEIDAVDKNQVKKRTPFKRLKKLANLIEKQLQVTQDIPNYTPRFELKLVGNLRRQAIACAPSDAERDKMIQLLQK